MKNFDWKSFVIHAVYACAVALIGYLLSNVETIHAFIANYTNPEVAGVIIAIVAPFLKKLGDSLGNQ